MALTVTATQGGGSASGMVLRVYVLTGASALQNGAKATQSAAAAHNASITTTVTGSQVYGACMNGAAATPTVFSAATTIIDAIADATHTKDYTTCKATSTTGTPGPTTLGFTDSNNGGIALYEVLPSGTIAQDPSSPAVTSTTAATTLTTASFTPPAGCVLIALIATNGTTNGTVTMTVSDTSGLTWTAQAQANASNMKYAGVFTAVIPLRDPPLVALPGPAWRAQFARGRGILPATGFPLGFYQGTLANTLNSGSGTITTSGSLIDGDPFTSVVTSGNSPALTYDSAHAAHGAQSLNITTGGTPGGTAYVQWAQLGPQSQVWFRFYLYVTGYPASVAEMVGFFTPSGLGNGYIALDSTGVLLLGDGSHTWIAQTVTKVPVNAWVRVEGFRLAGYVDSLNRCMGVSLYTQMDSVTATETVSDAVAQTQTNAFTGPVAFGCTTTFSNYAVWLDDLGISTTGPLGPATGAGPSDGGPPLAAMPGKTWQARFRRRQVMADTYTAPVQPPAAFLAPPPLVVGQGVKAGAYF